jgi:hypothetical protein
VAIYTKQVMLISSQRAASASILPAIFLRFLPLTLVFGTFSLIVTFQMSCAIRTRQAIEQLSAGIAAQASQTHTTACGPPLPQTTSAAMPYPPPMPHTPPSCLRSTPTMPCPPPSTSLNTTTTYTCSLHTPHTPSPPPAVAVAPPPPLTTCTTAYTPSPQAHPHCHTHQAKVSHRALLWGTPASMPCFPHQASHLSDLIHTFCLGQKVH